MRSRARAPTLETLRTQPKEHTDENQEDRFTTTLSSQPRAGRGLNRPVRGDERLWLRGGEDEGEQRQDEEHQSRGGDYKQDRRRRRHHSEARAGRRSAERDERGQWANAARLGGAAPGECQTGWLKSSLVVDTSGLSDATPDATVPGAFDCASKAADAVTIHRIGTGRYTLTLAGLDSGVAISSSANVGGGAANVVTAASKVDAQGKVNLNVWNNGDAALVDGKTVSLIVF